MNTRYAVTEKYFLQVTECGINFYLESEVLGQLRHNRFLSFVNAIKTGESFKIQLEPSTFFLSNNSFVTATNVYQYSAKDLFELLKAIFHLMPFVLMQSDDSSLELVAHTRSFAQFLHKHYTDEQINAFLKAFKFGGGLDIVEKYFSYTLEEEITVTSRTKIKQALFFHLGTLEALTAMQKMLLKR